MTDAHSTAFRSAGSVMLSPADLDHDVHDAGESGFDAPSPNPLRAGMGQLGTPAPCVMVIFGASGDLTSRKLMPALYDLVMASRLPEGFSIVGVSRRPWSDEQFRDEMRAAVEEHATMPVTQDRWESFAQGLFYVAGSFTDGEVYASLGDRLATVDQERRTEGNRLFYLATPPSFYIPIVNYLGANHLVERQDFYSAPVRGWTRIVVEKPIGHDLESARALNHAMSEVVSESQIYRIDHYLGKETVQNMLAFRFANVLFEPVWNRHYVDHVQMTVAESLGVENRATYYEEAGALRDMVQSHMLQLLSIVAMEPPAVFRGNAVRDEKVKVLRSIVPPRRPEEIRDLTTRGQYAAGFVEGRQVPGYRQEQDVSPTSVTETFAAMRLEVDNWRWADVPFYLRTGKRLPRRVTEIAIQFKRVPHLMFQAAGTSDVEPNLLTMRIQPDEGIALRFAAKIPGTAMQLRPVRMDFAYGAAFGGAGADAYERLLVDAMSGDQTLFARRDEVETAWTIVEPTLEFWDAEQVTGLPLYEAGTWGPDKSDLLIERDGRTWRRP